MNALELKNILISQISKIDDESFLSALKTILDSRNEKSINYLEEYNHELFLAEEDIKKEQLFSQSDQEKY